MARLLVLLLLLRVCGASVVTVDLQQFPLPSKPLPWSSSSPDAVLHPLIGLPVRARLDLGPTSPALFEDAVPAFLVQKAERKVVALDQSNVGQGAVNVTITMERGRAVRSTGLAAEVPLTPDTPEQRFSIRVRYTNARESLLFKSDETALGDANDNSWLEKHYGPGGAGADAGKLAQLRAALSSRCHTPLPARYRTVLSAREPIQSAFSRIDCSQTTFLNAQTNPNVDFFNCLPQSSTLSTVFGGGHGLWYRAYDSMCCCTDPSNNATGCGVGPGGTLAFNSADAFPQSAAARVFCLDQTEPPPTPSGAIDCTSFVTALQTCLTTNPTNQSLCAGQRAAYENCTSLSPPGLCGSNLTDLPGCSKGLVDVLDLEADLTGGVDDHMCLVRFPKNQVLLDLEVTLLRTTARTNASGSVSLRVEELATHTDTVLIGDISKINEGELEYLGSGLARMKNGLLKLEYNNGLPLSHADSLEELMTVAPKSKLTQSPFTPGEGMCVYHFDNLLESVSTATWRYYSHGPRPYWNSLARVTQMKVSRSGDKILAKKIDTGLNSIVDFSNPLDWGAFQGTGFAGKCSVARSTYAPVELDRPRSWNINDNRTCSMPASASASNFSYSAGEFSTVVLAEYDVDSSVFGMLHPAAELELSTLGASRTTSLHTLDTATGVVSGNMSSENVTTTEYGLVSLTISGKVIQNCPGHLRLQVRRPFDRSLVADVYAVVTGTLPCHFEVTFDVPVDANATRTWISNGRRSYGSGKNASSYGLSSENAAPQLDFTVLLLDGNTRMTLHPKEQTSVSHDVDTAETKVEPFSLKDDEVQAIALACSAIGLILLLWLLLLICAYETKDRGPFNTVDDLEWKKAPVKKVSWWLQDRLPHENETDEFSPKRHLGGVFAVLCGGALRAFVFSISVFLILYLWYVGNRHCAPFAFICLVRSLLTLRCKVRRSRASRRHGLSRNCQQHQRTCTQPQQNR
jgi:hypothetical protein